MASNDVATSDDKENAGKSIDDTNGLQCIRIIQNLRGCKRKIPIRQLTTEITSCNPTGVGAEITYIFTEKSLIVQFATQDSVRLLLSNSDLLSKYGLAVEKMAPKILAGGREDKHSLLMMGLPKNMAEVTVRKKLKATEEFRNSKLTIEWVSATSVLVTNTEEIKDFTSVRKHIERGFPTVVVSQVFIREFVHVKNIEEGINKEKLELYFNRPAVGGGDIKNIYFDDCTREAVIQFENPEDANKVLKKEHKLDGKHLEVERYNFFVDEKELGKSRGLSSGTDSDGTDSSVDKEKEESQKHKKKYSFINNDLREALISKERENKNLQDKLVESESRCDHQQTLINELQMKIRLQEAKVEVMKVKCAECEKKDVELKKAERELKEAEAMCSEKGNIIKELRTRQQENVKNSCGETCCAEGPILQEVDEDCLSRNDISDLTPIAENGAGSVSRANFRGKIVAIKDYHSRYSTLGFNRASLYRSHEKFKFYAGRHTVSAVGVVDDKDTAISWHVTEYEERGSLRKFLADKSTTCTWIQKVYFALGVCQCLSLLHNSDNPVVLGKIGSNKFLLGLNWEVKMCDFDFTDTPDRAREYLNKQNRSYMPPEHITESPVTYNIKTECYGVGVTLSEIATRVSDTEAKTLPDDCPDEYRKVVNGLMEPDPCSRMNITDAAMALTSLHTRLCAEEDSNGSCR